MKVIPGQIDNLRLHNLCYIILKSMMTPSSGDSDIGDNFTLGTLWG